MSNPTILTCAVTGNHTTRAQNPNLPVTPQEIATASIEAGRAGAAIAHIHVRDPETGSPSTKLEYYREVTEIIRDSGSDILINLTTGPGGRFVPGEADPAVAGPGTNLVTAEKRVEHIVALKPDLCSLDLNTMWFGPSAVINAPKIVRRMAELIRGAGVKPELEVFDTGDIHLARALIEEGVLEKNSLFQIVGGVNYGLEASPAALLYATSLIPAACQWAAFGIGRMSFPIVAQAWMLGGHVRVGLEDNIYLAKGQLAKSNAELCEKASRIVSDLGGTLASPAEARQILQLAG